MPSVAESADASCAASAKDPGLHGVGFGRFASAPETRPEDEKRKEECAGGEVGDGTGAVAQGTPIVQSIWTSARSTGVTADVWRAVHSSAGGARTRLAPGVLPYLSQAVIRDGRRERQLHAPSVPERDLSRTEPSR